MRNIAATRLFRVVVIGGTRAFGVGMPASWTVATVVRQQVMLAIDRPGRVTLRLPIWPSQRVR